MKAKLRKIADRRTTDERVVIDILADTDIGQYVVFDTTYAQNNSISNRMRHAYWFPDKKVKLGDVVVLYTRAGTQSETKNGNGTTSHFFYWNLGNKVWNDDNDCAVLMHVDEWTFIKS